MAFTHVNSAAFEATGSSGPTLQGTFNVTYKGSLLIVGYSSYNGSTPTFSLADTGGNTWIQCPGAPEYDGSGISSGFFWAIANGAGNTTITLTGPTVSYLAFAVSEFSAASGATILLAASNTNDGTSSAPALNSLTFSGGGNFLAYGSFSQGVSSSQTVGSGFTLLESFPYSSGHHMGQLDQYQAVTASSSPLTIGATWGGNSTWSGSGGVFAETFPTLAAGPSIVADRSRTRRGLQSRRRPVLTPPNPPYTSPSFGFVNQATFAGSTGNSSTLAIAYPVVAAGDVLVMGFSAYDGTNGTTFSVTDPLNVWHAGQVASASSIYSGCFWTVASRAGATAATLTASASGFLAAIVSEYSITPGLTAIAAGAAPGTGSNGSPSSGNVAFAGPGDFLLYGTVAHADSSTETYTAGTGFTAVNGGIQYSSGHHIGQFDEYQLNLASVASPVAATATLGTGTAWSMSGLALRAGIAPIVVAPSLIPAGHSGHITLSVAGNGTNWAGGTTTFTATGAGVTFVSQSITSSTAATIVVTTSGSTGPVTISDGTNVAYVLVATPSLSLFPGGAAINASTTISVTGVDTLWLSEPTSPPLFSASGLAGATVSNIVVTTNTTATFTLITASTTGTVTLADASTGTTAALSVFATAPGFTGSPGFLPANQANVPLVLTGTDTTWSGSTNFAVSGVGGVSIVGTPAVASSTLATITVTTGSAGGTLAITDGSYLCTIPVIPAATIGSAYVGRSGQVAYFVANATTGSFAPPAATTYTVVGTTVGSGGSGYTAPTAAISGGVALTLTDGGSGYTTPPVVKITGGGGTGAGAMAVLSGGVSLALTDGGTGYTSWPTVAITGGTGSGAQAVATSGVGLAVATGGSGYSSSPLPTVVFGGPGSGATATLTVSGGVVTGVTVTNAGYGYTSTSTATVTGASGSGATLTLSPSGGAVGGLSVTPGSGYLNGPDPTVTIAGGGGSGATATASIPSGAVSGFTLTPGSGYTSTPTVTISGGRGTGATATAAVASAGGTGCLLGTPIVSGGAIIGVPVVTPGSGYTSAPTIVVADPTGNGAVVSAVLGGPPSNVTAVVGNPTISVNGNPVAVPLTLNAIPVSAGGSGYTSTPSVAIAGGTGSGAVGTATITAAGQVALTLTNGGSGYLSPPTVTIGNAPTGGTTAKATAWINTSGSVIGFVATPGSGYTSAPSVTISPPPSGTPATATATYASGSVSSIAASNLGSGYAASDTLSVSIAGGGGSGAAANAVVGPAWSDNTTDNTERIPFVAYQLQCGGVASILVQGGGSNYVTPVATAGGGGGTGLVLGTPVLVNNAISSLNFGGSDTQSNSIRVIDNAGTGSGFVGYFDVTTPGNTASAVSGVTIENGGRNYSTNLSFGYNSFNGQHSGATFTLNSRVGGVIASIPVISPGSGYTSAPTITITDVGGGTGAAAAAVMSGPAPTDVVTYSAPANWLTTAAGPVPAATSAPLQNFAGQLEPAFAQLPRTMKLSQLVMSPFGYASGKSINQNWLKGVNANWTGASNPATGSTLLALGSSPYTPITALVTNGSTAVTLSASASGLANQYVWFPGDSTGTLYKFAGGSGTSWVLASNFLGATLSAAPVWTAPTASLVIHNGDSDSTGQLAQGFAVVDGAGAIAGITITCPGTGYTTAPNVTIPAPASGGAQAYATATVSGGFVTGFSISTAGSGYGGSAGDGHPIAVNAPKDASNTNNGGTPNAYATVANNQGQSGVDGAGLPDLAGTWTFVADEANPSSPMAVTLYSASAGHFAAATITRGVLADDGVEVGKTWSFVVARPGITNPLNLQLNVAGPSAASSAPWTLSNEVLTAPARGTGLAVVPDRDNPMAPDPNMVDSVTMGTTGATSLRLWPFGQYEWWNNVVDATDLRASTDFTYSDGPQRNTDIVVTAIRQYVIYEPGNPGWYSPYVYTSNAYPGTAASPGGSPLPYYWVPPGNTSANSVQWMGKGSGAANQSSVHEFVTAAPHGIKTGQAFTIPANALTAAVPIYDPNANANITVSLSGLYLSAYVTGPNTFAVITQTNSNIAKGLVANTTGTHACNFTITFAPPPDVLGHPYEAFTGMVSAVPGCGLHTFIPTFATDACVAAIARRIRDTLPVGRAFYPEYVNEHWNSVNEDFQNMYTMAGLCATGGVGIAPNNVNNYYVYRTAAIHDIIIDTFNQADADGNTGRGNSVVRVFGGWAGVAGAPTNASEIAFANQYNAGAPANPIRIDALLVAPYQELPYDPTIAAAAAATYSNYPGSTRYRTASPWTMGAYVDFMRHCLFYMTEVEAAVTAAQLPAYNLAPGQTAPPFVMCYEASISSVVPTGVSTTNSSLRGYIGHDVYFHPYLYDADQAYYAGLQQGGVGLATVFNLVNPRSPDTAYDAINGAADFIGAVIWGYATWEGMTWGKGDGTPDGNGNATTNLFFNGTGAAHDLVNASPKMQSWRDWASVANVVPTSPAPGARPRWFPGLSRR